MSSTIRASIVAITLMTLAPLLAACNTAAGAGKDVSAAGHAVTRTADDVKNGL